MITIISAKEGDFTDKIYNDHLLFWTKELLEQYLEENGKLHFPGMKLYYFNKAGDKIEY